MRKFFWKRLVIGAEGSRALTIEPGSYVVMRCASLSSSIAKSTSVVQTTVVCVTGPFVNVEQERAFIDDSVDIFSHKEIEFKNDGSWIEETMTEKSSTDDKS